MVTSFRQLMSLQGRRALITGATGRLGATISETLAELGADLVLVDRPGTVFDPLLQSLQILTKSTSAAFQTIHCDLEREEHRCDLIQTLGADGQGLSVLINNAAFLSNSDLQGWAVPFEQQSLETWRRALEVNLTAVFHLCQGLASLLRSSPGSCIINVASIYGHHGPDWSLYEGTSMGNPAAYGATKGGLIQLTRWLATTLAPDVRVNGISPGGIYRNQPEVFVQRYNQRTPMARMATEDDFRGVVGFLASDLSSYVTGQVLQVDGGWSSW